jgi:hypothetical protein
MKNCEPAPSGFPGSVVETTVPAFSGSSFGVPTLDETMGEHGVKGCSVVETLPGKLEKFTDMIGSLIGVELENESTGCGFHDSLQLLRVFLLRHE